jgi:replicative DNA helicase
MRFSEDAEKGVLCSLLLSPKEVADLCVEHLLPEAFYIRAHQIIYGLILELGGKSRSIEFVFLKQALKDRNQLEEIGGPEYLSELYNFVPTAANAAYYIDIVHEKYVLRWSI